MKSTRDRKFFLFVEEDFLEFVFCDPETILYKKVNKSVSNKISVHLEDAESIRVDFNDATMTITILLFRIKVQTYG